MHRKELLKFLFFLPVVPLVRPFYFHPSNLTATKPGLPLAADPISIITMSLNVAKLFTGIFQSGPSMVDFIKNVNEQLGIINQKLGFLITEIQEIKKLVWELPENLVSAINQIQLKGRIDDYKAIMTEVNLPEYRGNIRKYMKVPQNRTEVENLVSEIRQVKSNLRQFNDPFLIPFIAVGIQMEYYLRNNFLQQKWVDFLGDINNDKIWLANNVYNFQNAASNRLKSLLEERAGFLSWTSHTFAVLIDDTRDYLNIYRGKVLNNVDTSIVEPAELKNLRSIGLLNNATHPSFFSFNINEAALLTILARGYEGAIDFVVQSGGTIAQEQDRIKAKINSYVDGRNNELKLNYFSTIAMGCSLYAGLKAIEFCNVYINAAKMAQK